MTLGADAGMAVTSLLLSPWIDLDPRVLGGANFGAVLGAGLGTLATAMVTNDGHALKTSVLVSTAIGLAGGGALTISPGYHLILETFSALINGPVGAGATTPSALNYLSHRITLENRWRFLPKTAVLLDGEFGFRQYLTASGSNTPISIHKFASRRVTAYSASAKK